MNFVGENAHDGAVNAPDNHIAGPKDPETNAVEGNSTVCTQLSTLY